ncbi:caspase family protein [Lentzea californiensis]|uniref:caspase family protein n=1 Tax=Lentzea californiensis TaxID=438851 RepID=UPI00216539EB|nr:caspase family protein [Lentzea californiensis]MCR3752678.1 Caspase domain-containing protein [Lentzea californiensis]
MSSLRVMSLGFNWHRKDTERRLQFAEADAVAVAEGISTQKLHHLQHVELITNSRSSLEIEQTIKQQISASEMSDSLLFYFAGHGMLEEVSATEQALFLVCKDTDIGDVTNTALDLARLIQMFEDARSATALIVLDCCFSGSLGGRSILGPRYLRRLQTGRPFRRKRIPTPVGAGKSVLSACGAHQEAAENSSLGHGVFTHSFLTAITSKTSSSMSVAAVYSQVQESVLRRTDGKQCPSLYGGDHGAQIPTIRKK